MSRRNRLFGFLDSYTMRALAACNATAKKGRKCTTCKAPIAADERYRFTTTRVTSRFTAQHRECGTCVRASVVGDDAFTAQRRAQRHGQPFASRVFFTIMREAGVPFHKGGTCNDWMDRVKNTHADERCNSCDAYKAFMARPLAEVAARVEGAL
jgi:hypothetical protein